MKKIFKIFGIILAILIVIILLCAGGYVFYLENQYYRIEDFSAVETNNNAAQTLKPNQSYTAATYNIGFGAYGPNYTFFMDTGIMSDGTKTVGSQGTADSEEAVLHNTNGCLTTIQLLNPDIILLQEVDTNSTRSFKVNQSQIFTDALSGYSASYISNFHSGFLLYPFTNPHGLSNAGLQTHSRYNVSETVRRSYPIDNNFFLKFFDIDRCFSMHRMPVEGGKELVVINSHMSAYDSGGTIRAKQLELLNTVLSEEYAKGNYIIVGGDFNHALAGSAEIYPSNQLRPTWVFDFDQNDLADGFSVVKAENIADVPTCRGVDIPYEKGHTYTTTVDGFIVSDNIKATAQNINTEFAYSDHQPVLMTFELIK